MALINLNKTERKGNREKLLEMILRIISNERLIANTADCCVRSMNQEIVELDVTLLPNYNKYFLRISTTKGGRYDKLLEYKLR